MIVRWMTQYSLESAKFYDVRDDQEPFALYEWAQQSISEGRQFIIDGAKSRYQPLWKRRKSTVSHYRCVSLLVPVGREMYYLGWGTVMTRCLTWRLTISA